jgi:hypothetical protein
MLTLAEPDIALWERFQSGRVARSTLYRMMERHGVRAPSGGEGPV